MSDLRESDQQAVGDVVRILNEAGVDVEKTNHLETNGEGGITFKLHCKLTTRYSRFTKQLALVKQAAIEAPEIGLDGQEVDDE